MSSVLVFGLAAGKVLHRVQHMAIGGLQLFCDGFGGVVCHGNHAVNVSSVSVGIPVNWASRL
jgi:hypothetical protein